LLSLVFAVAVSGQLLRTPQQQRGQSGSKDATCFFYGAAPLVPQPALSGQLETCCWYSSSTCCYWLNVGYMLAELWKVVARGGVSKDCYTQLADIYCAGCAPNTNDFVEINSDNVIKVTLCKNTCFAFYDACREEADQIKVKDPITFCENYQHIFRLIDDSHYDANRVHIRVSRNSDASCFHSLSVVDGGSAIENLTGLKTDQCVPPLVPPPGVYFPTLPPPPPPSEPGPNQLYYDRFDNFEFPFPLPPFQKQQVNGRSGLAAIFPKDESSLLHPNLSFVFAILLVVVGGFFCSIIRCQ